MKDDKNPNILFPTPSEPTTATEIKYSVEDQPVTTTAPTLAEEFTAGRTIFSNDIWAGIKNIGVDLVEPEDENFNPYAPEYREFVFGDLTPEEIERFQPNIARAKNLNHLIKIKQEIDFYKKQSEVFAYDNSGLGTASFLAGVLTGIATDPVNLIAGAGAFNAAFKTAKAGFVAAKGAELSAKANVALGASIGAGLNLGAMATSNLISQGTYSETDEELLWALSIAGPLGGVLGGLSGRAATRYTAETAEEYISQALKGELKANTPTEKLATSLIQHKRTASKIDDAPVQIGSRSIGAAENVDALPADAFKLKPSQSTNPIINSVFNASSALGRKFSPGLRMLNSESVTTREFATRFHTTPLEVTNRELAGANVPSLAKAETNFLLNNEETARVNYFNRYRQNGGKLSESKFSEELDFAVKEGRQSAIPEVNEYIENHLKPTMRKLYDIQDELGLHADRPTSVAQVLKEDYTVPQAFDLEAIASDIPRAREDFAKGIQLKSRQVLKVLEKQGIQEDIKKFNVVQKEKQTVAKLKKEVELAKLSNDSKLGSLQESLKNARSKLKSLREDAKFKLTKEQEELVKLYQREFLKANDEKVAKQSAIEAIESLLGNDSTSGSVGVKLSSAKPQFLKARELALDKAEMGRYLSKRSTFEILQRYYTEHARAVAKKKALGDLDGTLVKEAINNDYKTRVDKLVAKQSKLDPASDQYVQLSDQIEKLLKKRTADIDDVTQALYRFDSKNYYGESAYHWNDAVYQIVTGLSTSKLMGMLPVAQIPDLANIAVPLASGKYGKEISKFAQATKETVGKLSTRDKKILSLHAEEFEHRVAGIWDANVRDMPMSISNKSKLARAGSSLKQMTYKLSGATAMNNFTRSVIGETLSQDLLAGMLNKVERGKKPGAAIQNILDTYGIRDVDMKKIVEQYRKHAKDVDGVKMSNVAAWNREQRDLFSSTIQQVVENDFVIASGLLNKPFIFDHPFWQLFAQFQGFWMKAYESYYMKGLQQASFEELTKALFRGILGSVSYVARTATRQPVEDIDMDPTRLVYEGITRGGVLPGVDFVAMQMDNIGRLTNTGFGPAAWVGARRERAFGTDKGLEDIILGAAGVVKADTEKLLQSTGNGTFPETAAKLAFQYTPVGGTIYSNLIINKLIED